MFGLQARAAARPGPRRGAGAGRVTALRCSSLAVLLVAARRAPRRRRGRAVAGLARRAPRSSRARAAAERTALQQVARRPGPLPQPAALLRVTCELVATVLVTVVCARRASTTQLAGRARRRRRRWSWCPTSRSASRRARSAASTPTPVALVARPVRAPAGPGARPAAAAADPARQRAHARARASARARSPPRPSCATWSTWPRRRSVIEDGEREMIHSVFELGDTIVREVMVPRTDMVFIERDKTLRQALSLALRSGFSRIPVVGENVDDVVGVVYLKDLVRRTHEHREGESTEQVDVGDAPGQRSCRRASRSTSCCARCRPQQTHMAIVVDEYGGTAGLVTIEDILEEIVGEITDEYDVEAAAGRASCADGSLRVTARLPVDDLAELLRRRARGRRRRDRRRPAGQAPRPGADPGRPAPWCTASSSPPRAPQGRRNRIGTVLVRRAAARAGRRSRWRPPMSATPDGDASTAEDAKLVTLARSARARVGGAEGAAVRDDIGRTYAAAHGGPAVAAAHRAAGGGRGRGVQRRGPARGRRASSATPSSCSDADRAVLDDLGVGDRAARRPRRHAAPARDGITVGP